MGGRHGGEIHVAKSYQRAEGPINKSSRFMESVLLSIDLHYGTNQPLTNRQVRSVHAGTNVNQHLIKALESNQSYSRILNINDDENDYDRDHGETNNV